MQDITDDRQPTHDLTEAIRATSAAEDYEFDAIAVSTVNYALSDYLDAQECEDALRKNAGTAARERLDALTKSIDNVFRDWHDLCANVYAKRAIIDANLKLANITTGGGADVAASDEHEPPTPQSLAAIDDAIQDFGELAGLRRLHEVVATAMADFDAAPDGLPEFRRGHQPSLHQDKLTTRLLRLAHAEITKQRGMDATASDEFETASESYKLASELLSIVNITVTTKHLRNRFPVSRQFDAEAT